MNGFLVVETDLENEIDNQIVIFAMQGEIYLLNEDIKSIVTKEQFSNMEYELVENEINIQNIEELNKRDTDYIRQNIYEVVKNNREATIELQKAVKQLDREIKRLEEDKQC